jgi:hypothetical protein
LCKVWNIGTIHFYAEQLSQGRKLPAAISGVEDDPLQMGGDFTLDRNLKLVMSYPSKIPADRPAIDHILKNIK